MPIYSEDLTGVNPANRITNESHPVGNVQNVSHRTIVPTYAPFFANGFDIEHVSAANVVTPMTVDVDYKLSLEYVSARESLVTPVNGGITIYSNFNDGNYRIKAYQTIGGSWIADPAAVLQTILTLAYNPRVVFWEQVTNVQTQFPPDLHTQPAEDLTRLNDLLLKVEELKLAILNSASLSAHTTASNPHALAMLTAIEKNVVLTAIGANTTSSLSATIKNRQITVNDLLELTNAVITYRS